MTRWRSFAFGVVAVALFLGAPASARANAAAALSSASAVRPAPALRSVPIGPDGIVPADGRNQRETLSRRARDDQQPARTKSWVVAAALLLALATRTAWNRRTRPRVAPLLVNPAVRLRAPPVPVSFLR